MTILFTNKIKRGVMIMNSTNTLEDLLVDVKDEIFAYSKIVNAGEANITYDLPDINGKLIVIYKSTGYNIIITVALRLHPMNESDKEKEDVITIAKIDKDNFDINEKERDRYLNFITGKIKMVLADVNITSIDVSSELIIGDSMDIETHKDVKFDRNLIEGSIVGMVMDTDQDDEYHKSYISKNIRNSLVVTIPLHDNIKNKFIITVEKLICTPRIRYNTVTVLITLSPYDDDYYGIVCQEQDLCTEVVFSFDRDKLLDAESRKGLRQYTKTQIQDMVNALVEKFQIIYGDKHVNMRLIREEF